MLGAGHAGWLLFVNVFSTLGGEWIPSSIKPYSSSNSRNLLYWWLTVQEQPVDSAPFNKKSPLHLRLSPLTLFLKLLYIDIYKNFSKVSNLESLLFYLGMQRNNCQFLKVYRFSLFIQNDQILNSNSLNFLSSEITFFSYFLQQWIISYLFDRKTHIYLSTYQVLNLLLFFPESNFHQCSLRLILTK